MNCAAYREHLPGLLYGDLQAEIRQIVEEHLVACPDCRKERLEFQGLQRQV